MPKEFWSSFQLYLGESKLPLFLVENQSKEIFSSENESVDINIPVDHAQLQEGIQIDSVASKSCGIDQVQAKLGKTFICIVKSNIYFT